MVTSTKKNTKKVELSSLQKSNLGESVVVIEVGKKVKTISVDSGSFVVLHSYDDGIYYVGYLNHFVRSYDEKFRFLGQPSQVFCSRLNEIPLDKMGYVSVPYSSVNYFEDCLKDEGFVVVKSWSNSYIYSYLVKR